MNQGEDNKEGMWVRIPPGLLHYIVEVILNPVPGEDVLEASLADLIIDLLGEYALQVKQDRFVEDRTGSIKIVRQNFLM